MYQTVEEIKAANAKSGYHFFSPGAMRFFRSRVLPGVIQGCFFITSEQFDTSSPRLYTIRRAGLGGGVETVGNFQHYKTADAARRAAARLHLTPSSCANCGEATYNPNFTCDDCQEATAAE